jgi:hypothetical protein
MGEQNMQKFEKQKIVILLIWILSMVISLLGTLYYEWKTTKQGIVYITNEDMIEALKLVGVFYGTHLGARLLAAFVEHKKILSSRGKTYINCFLAAIICTVLFNTLVLFFVFHGYFATNPEILSDFKQLKSVGTVFSFLVIPINIYYFGIGQKE